MGTPQQLKASLFLMFLLESVVTVVQRISLLRRHVVQETHHSVVDKFVVIPGNEHGKVVIENNASPGIKDSRVGVTV